VDGTVDGAGATLPAQFEKFLLVQARRLGPPA
jgi:hypothetical protein